MTHDPHQILSREEGPAAEVVNPAGRAALCLICEHASPVIPSSLGSLGLADADRMSHAAWDPGAAALARHLCEVLDAPLVLGRVSRLVHDCNRPPERTDAIPTRVETIDIPGNRDLSREHRAARVREIYDTFHRSVTETLEAFAAPPVLVTVHTFSPQWFGTPRDTEVGLLHDKDDRMARAMLKAAPARPSFTLNQPYSAADGVTHMLARHAVARGLDNVMIEVRNDLLDGAADVQRMGAILHSMIAAALAREGAT